MAIRRFGPVKGAGTVVVEKTGAQSITPSAFGVIGVVGQFERGEVSRAAAPRANYCGGPASFAAKMGGRMAGSITPDAVQDYFSHSEGAGEVVAVRVTDGTEKAARVDLYSRHWGAGAESHLFPSSELDNQSQTKVPVLRVTAKNGGRWGGRRRQLPFGRVTVATAVEETSIDLGCAMRENEFAGATLFIIELNKSYEVVANTTAGVIVLKSDCTLLSDAGSETTLSGVVGLDNLELETGARKGLGVRVKEATIDPSVNFGLEVYVDGELVLNYDTLSMDPASAYFIESLVNEDSSNTYVEVESLLPDGTTIIPDLRPANFYGRLVELTATEARFRTAQVVQAPANARVVAVQCEPLPAAFLSSGLRIVGTWNLGTGHYDIEIRGIRHEANGDEPLPLPGACFDVGVGEQYHKHITAGGVDLIIDHEAAVADGAQLIIDVLPLETASLEGAIYVPDAKNAPYRRFRVVRGDFESVVIESGDPRTVVASTLASVRGSVAGPFAISTGVNDLLQVKVDGYTSVAVTLTAGASRTAAQVATDINTAFDAIFGTGVLNPARADGDYLELLSPGFAGRGHRSSIELDAATTPAYATLGLVEGDTYGTDSTGPESAELVSRVVGPFAITGETNDGYSFKVDGRKEVSGTLTAGAARTAAQIATELNAAFDAVFGAGNVNPFSVYTDDSGDHLKVTSPGFDGGGPASSIEILAAANDCYETLGFLPSSVSPLVRGLAGAEGMLMYLDEPANGHDGGAPSDQDYIDALSISNSPFNKVEGKGKGVLQLIAPGVTSTMVQQAGIAYAEAKNHVFVVQAPVALTDEQAMVDYFNGTIGRSDFALTYVPSFAYVQDPDGAGALKLVATAPMEMGRDALFARNGLAYSRPAAGLDATLPRIVKLPTTQSDGDDRQLNEEILTPQGINVIRKKKGNYVVWGARMLCRDTNFQWKSHRLQLSHYEHTMMEEFDWVIFMLNDAATRRQLKTVFNGFFAPELAKGAILGGSLEDALRLKIDEENNPPSEVGAGNLNAEMSLKFPDIVERFVITINKAGVFEGTS